MKNQNLLRCEEMTPADFLEWWKGILTNLKEPGLNFIDGLSGLVADILKNALKEAWATVIDSLIEMLDSLVAQLKELPLEEEISIFEMHIEQLCQALHDIGAIDPDTGQPTSDWLNESNVFGKAEHLKHAIEAWLQSITIAPDPHLGQRVHEINQMHLELNKLFCVLGCLSG